MANVSTYLNFPGNTEEAFLFYRSVFGGEFIGGIMRFSDVPPADGAPPMPEADKKLIMHIALNLPGNHQLMGTDAPESLGFKVNFGNNMYILLQMDQRQEVLHYFGALSKNGKVEMEPQDMFWGDFFCSFTDRFGVQWMISTPQKN